MAEPSTKWKEHISVDEAANHALCALQLHRTHLHQFLNEGDGPGLNRSQLLGLQARFEVRDGLPSHARQGLFAIPAAYDALVRISHGLPDLPASAQANHLPEVRCFAIKVLGVVGPGALGTGPTNSQDFLLINHPSFLSSNYDDFVAFVMRSLEGPYAVFRYLTNRLGFIRAVGKLLQLRKLRRRPFSGFATESFHSAAPLACGPYAVRVRLLPARVSAGAGGDWAKNFRGHLAAGPLKFELQLQFFSDETLTPIEDAARDWPDDVAPYITVGTLIIPVQDTESASGKALTARAETMVFDPWRALKDHRPLGEIMRARKIVFHEIEKSGKITRDLHNAIFTICAPLYGRDSANKRAQKAMKSILESDD